MTSTRKRARVNYAEWSSSEDEEFDSYEPEQEPEPPQPVRSPNRRRKATLQGLPTLPVDLLHEIFSHLDPLDLLHLARSTKAFRSFLLNKNAIGIWRSAREHIEGLPPCPPYLSEPAYANLAFSPYCHECLTGNIQNVIWTFNVRYCNRCKNRLTVDSYMLGGRGGYAAGLTADMFCSAPGERRRMMYHKPEVEAIWQKWLALPETDKAKTSFMDERRELVGEISRHANLCIRWHEARKVSRNEELQQIKQAKVEAVVERLTALGWGEELEPMKPYYNLISDHNLVRAVKKINDKAWKGIESGMVSFMKKCRKDRLIAQRRKELGTRLVWLKDVIKSVSPTLRTNESDYGPSFVDLALMPEIRDIAELPSSKSVTKEMFVALGEKLPDFTNRWVCNAEERLEQVAREGLPGEDFETSPLLLACTFFDCMACKKRDMQYRSVIGHDCLHQRYYSYCRDDDVSYFYQDLAMATDHCRPWSCQNLTIGRATKRAQAVIEACGLNPMTATHVDLKELSPRLLCKTCSRPGVRMVMPWRTAVDHARTAHSGIEQEEAEWEVVGDKEAELARKIEANHADPLFDDYYPHILWSCARCTINLTRNLPLNQVLEHLRRQHGIQNPTIQDKDIYPSCDSPGLIVRPVTIVDKTLSFNDLTDAELNSYSKSGGSVCDFKAFDIHDPILVEKIPKTLEDSEGPSSPLDTLTDSSSDSSSSS